jgi:hypothetical protein
LPTELLSLCLALLLLLLLLEEPCEWDVVQAGPLPAWALGSLEFQSLAATLLLPHDMLLSVAAAAAALVAGGGGGPALRPARAAGAPHASETAAGGAALLAPAAPAPPEWLGAEFQELSFPHHLLDLETLPLLLLLLLFPYVVALAAGRFVVAMFVLGPGAVGCLVLETLWST